MSAILYSFRRCPYAIRARLALWVSQQMHEVREVVLARKPAEMLQASPKGTVPVLLLASGQVLEQSLDIMLWALRQHDPRQWLPAERHGLEQALALIGRCDGPFKQALDRYKYPDRHAQSASLSAIELGQLNREIGGQFLLDLENRLTQAAYLHGTHFGLADAAVAPFVRQFAHTDADWFARQAWPRLAQWLTAFEKSEDFQAIMHKYPAWQAGNAPVMLPVQGLVQA